MLRADEYPTKMRQAIENQASKICRKSIENPILIQLRGPCVGAGAGGDVGGGGGGENP